MEKNTPNYVKAATVDITELQREIADLKTQLKDARREVIENYYQGMKEGITRYAWWKDGYQEVGTTGTSLREAIKKVKEEAEAALGKGE